MSLLLLFDEPAGVAQVLPSAGRWQAVPVVPSLGPLTKVVLPAVARWQGVGVAIVKGGISKSVLPAVATWLARPITIGTGFTVAVGAALARWTGVAISIFAPGGGARNSRPFRRRR